MKQQSTDAKANDEIGKGSGEYNQANEPIQASGDSINNEREKRVNEEQGTKKIEGHRKSLKDTLKHRRRPLL